MELTMAKKKNKEVPEDSATVEVDVDPTLRTNGEDTELAHEDGYTPPSYPNEAADETQDPHEDTRPQTKAERRDERYGSNE
jgi:hypothetical protein